MIHRLIHALTVLLAVAAFGLTAHAQQPQSQARFAFVIGNDGYEGAEMPTASNDAALIADMLKSAGFDLTGARNLDQETLRASYREFLEKVAAAGPGAVAFVYLSGYGVQLEGENYFIPPGAQIARAADIQLNGVRLTDITRTLAGMPALGRIMVFDLAYEGPFGMATAPGFAAMRAGAGDLIAFNAAPGSVAPMSQPPYGAFAQALAESVREPGVPITDVFENVREFVSKYTNGAQTPWFDARIEPIILFEPRPNVARPTVRWAPPPPPVYVEDSYYYLPLPAARADSWLAPPVYVEAPPEPIYILPPEDGYSVSPWVAAPVALAAGIAAGSIIYRRDYRAREGFAPGRRFLPPIAAGPRGRQRPLPTALQQQNLQNFQQRPRPTNNQFQGGQQGRFPGQQPNVRPGQQGFAPDRQGGGGVQQGARPVQQLPDVRPGQQGFGVGGQGGVGGGVQQGVRPGQQGFGSGGQAGQQGFAPGGQGGRPGQPGLGQGGQQGGRPGQQGFGSGGQAGQQGFAPGGQGGRPGQPGFGQGGQPGGQGQWTQQQIRQQQLQQQRQQQIQQQQTRQQHIQQERQQQILQQQTRQQQIQQQRQQQIQQQQSRQQQLQQTRQQQILQQRSQQQQQQQRQQQMQQQQRSQQMQQQQRQQQMQQQRSQQQMQQQQRQHQMQQQQRQQQMQQQQRSQQMQQQQQQQRQQQLQQQQRQQQQRQACGRPGLPACR
ncbi:MAG: caspase family protein [Beijerinckiaceae bacterium]|nr:caspase family protein [Beijerinckiaceae bacterium]